MKRVAVPTQPLIAFFFALFLVVALTMTGCSASTLSGPDLAPSDEITQVRTPAPTPPGAAHNEGKTGDKKGKKPSNSTTTSADHND